MIPGGATLSTRGKRAEIRRTAQDPDIIQAAEEVAAIDITIADHGSHQE